MSRYQHKLIVEHLWRVLRALFIIAATAIWLSIDGVTGREWVVLGLVIGAALVDQFKGFIENKIEDILHWKRDFDSWE